MKRCILQSQFPLKKTSLRAILTDTMDDCPIFNTRSFSDLQSIDNSDNLPIYCTLNRSPFSCETAIYWRNPTHLQYLISNCKVCSVDFRTTLVTKAMSYSIIYYYYISQNVYLSQWEESRGKRQVLQRILREGQKRRGEPEVIRRIYSIVTIRPINGTKGNGRQLRCICNRLMGSEGGQQSIKKRKGGGEGCYESCETQGVNRTGHARNRGRVSPTGSNLHKVTK